VGLRREGDRRAAALLILVLRLLLLMLLLLLKPPDLCTRRRQGQDAGEVRQPCSLMLHSHWLLYCRPTQRRADTANAFAVPGNSIPSLYTRLSCCEFGEPTGKQIYMCTLRSRW